MPTIASTDGTKLHYEEAGSGTPIVFVHEFAGDYRTWEPQLRYFARAHRCVAFSARGYPPSEVPSDPARYGQDIARSDVIAVMDGLGIKKAHVVGHSMGAYTALHVGIRHPERCISVTAAGCGWGSVADPAVREDMRKLARETAAMFTEKGMTEAAVIYSDTPTRQTLWDMEADLKRFSVPLLVIVGDEDETCLDGSVFLKRTAPTAALAVIPRSGHTITSEEPAAFNNALAELFAAAESGRWLAHRPPA
jgi:pimeloyl-ACP methyl ester carboxylesterase